ncbi:MAG: alpha/beta fold hydrolase [Sneathiella sp.]
MTEETAPTGKRSGPRPLGLHLSLSSLSFGSSMGAIGLAKEGALAWLPELQDEAAKIQADMQHFAPNDLIAALGVEGQGALTHMLSGIEKYQSHPYRRHMPVLPAFWSKGSVSLYDYGVGLPNSAPIIFLVPSLVNKFYILDLMPDNSFVAGLVEGGVRPIVIDWGVPGEVESEYALDDYILNILVPALDSVLDEFPKAPVHLAGYCMGGTLATALAELKQDKLSSLITIAAPWDFHKGLGQSAKAILGNPTGWDSILQSLGVMPVDLIQSFFACLDPNLCLNKFTLFDQMVQLSPRAETFVALEDWLNDGVPLVKKAAHTCFVDWYGENSPALGNWRVGEKLVQPRNITIPSMIVVPKSDRIVPPESARALADIIPNATLMTPSSGHIGMIVGSTAKKDLWVKVLKWVSP